MRCWHYDIALSIVSSLEKGIIQGDEIDLPHPRIVHDIRIDKEEDWHINRFASIQFLLIETEALYLGEIGCSDIGSDVVRRNSNDVLGTEIRGGIEGERRLTRPDGDLSLLRCELPVESIRDLTVEVYADGPVIRDWNHPVWRESRGICDRSTPITRLLAIRLVHGHSGITEAQCPDQDRQSIHQPSRMAFIDTRVVLATARGT